MVVAGSGGSQPSSGATSHRKPPTVSALPARRRTKLVSDDEVAAALAAARLPEQVIEATPPIIEPEPEPEPESAPPAPMGGLFDGLDVPSEDALRPRDDIDLESDLTPSEREEFIRLLNHEMPIAERAAQLAKLARFTDQKRAAVGLRAIQEINAIAGVSGDAPRDTPPMFQLPEGTSVSVRIEKVLK